jgi:DNA-binding CsgD family transcriptional regulator
MRLAQTDLEGVVRFLGEAESVQGEEPFPPETLAALRRLVPCDAVAYEEQDRVQQQVLWFAEDPVCDGGQPTVDYWDIRQDYPPCHHQDLTGNFHAVKLSDFMSRRELWDSRIYAEFLRPLGIEHGILVGLDAPLSHTKVFLFDRSGGRDFTERDRVLLDLLRPHLANLYHAAQTRRRLRTALALLEHMEAPVVLVERGNRIAFASPAARDLLTRYWGTETRLPEQVVAWLQQDRSVPGGPLPVERNGRLLLVHRTKDGLLLEERQAQPRLTPRERQILELVASGETNAQIAARLWLSVGTVRRHLENIFAKLGVHTRTAAAAYVHRSHG